MTREEMENMIRDEVQSLAFSELKAAKSKKNTPSNKRVSEDKLNDLDNFLFPPKETVRSISNIHESVQLAQVTSTEIDEFEASFEEMLKTIPSASVVFKEQSNGYSMSIYSNEIDGVEAKASGVINLGQIGKIIWDYSINNGLHIQTGGLEINQENKLMLEKLFNHYDNWQKEWREKVMNPTVSDDGGADLSAPMGGSGMEQPGGGMGADLGQAETPGATSL